MFLLLKTANLYLFLANIIKNSKGPKMKNGLWSEIMGKFWSRDTFLSNQIALF